MPNVTCDHCGAALERSAFRARVHDHHFCDRTCKKYFEAAPLRDVAD